MPEHTEAQRRARLASFGLGDKNAETPAGDLSGGEKARLLFSLISFHAPHMLVLDEPANHLDMDSRAELIKSLNSYSGAVIVISHDRNLLESVVERLWLVDKGTVKPYDGSLEDYRAVQLETKKVKPKTSASEDTRADQRRATAQARASIAPLKKQAETIEIKINRLRETLLTIDKALMSPGYFSDHPDLAQAKTIERGQLVKTIDSLEEDWLIASESYEVAKAAL